MKREIKLKGDCRIEIEDSLSKSFYTITLYEDISNLKVTIYLDRRDDILKR